MRVLNKIVIIQAGKKICEGLVGKFLYSNLTCASIAAAVPEGIDIEIIDMFVQNIDYKTIEADLALVSTLTTHSQAAFEASHELRKKGITVVGGGVHIVVMPDECLEHFDAVAIGEAELLLDEIIDDFKEGKLKRRYETREQLDLTKCRPPRYDLLPLRKYAFFGIMASKGCLFDCDFCSSKLVTGPGFRHKSVEQVVGEIEYTRNLYEKDPLIPQSFCFIDSNLYTDRKFLMELLEALVPLKLKPWGLFASVNIARDDEVLDLLEKANCKSIQIGFESINPNSLHNVNKMQNNPLEYKEVVRKLSTRGIHVYGSFIFGFDNDDVSVFDETYKVIEDAGFIHAGFFPLTPFPGTRLFERMIKEDRILHRDWSKYTMEDVVFRPKMMTVEELERGFKDIKMKSSDPGRLIESLKKFKTYSSRVYSLKTHEKIALVLTYIFRYSRLSSRTRYFIRKILVNDGLVDYYQLTDLLPKIQNS